MIKTLFIFSRGGRKIGVMCSPKHLLRSYRMLAFGDTQQRGPDGQRAGPRSAWRDFGSRGSSAAYEAVMATL